MTTASALVPADNVAAPVFWPRDATLAALAVDAVLRYECLDDDLAGVGQRLGIDLHLPETKVKGDFRLDRRHYREVLDADSRALIETVCAREFEAFGYTWDES